MLLFRARNINLPGAILPSSSADQPGLFGSVTARAESQAVRLAMIYALLDGKTVICPLHMNAALALWRYCEASAEHIFGDATGDPVTDEIIRALRAAARGSLPANWPCGISL